MHFTIATLKPPLLYKKTFHILILLKWIKPWPAGFTVLNYKPIRSKEVSSLKFAIYNNVEKPLGLGPLLL